MVSPQIEDAQIFFSYTHKDAESIVGGGIRQFANDLKDSLEILYGKEVPCFLDRNQGQWGENLWGRLEEEIRRSSFFIPFITPTYLKSDACTKEFNLFIETAQKLDSEDLVLPLIWISPQEMVSTTSGNLVVERIKNTRYEDITKVRRESRDSNIYRKCVENLAQKINEIIEKREKPNEIYQVAESGGEEPGGLAEIISELEEDSPELVESLEKFIHDVEKLGNSLEEETKKVMPANPTNAMQTKVALARLRHELDPIASRTRESSHKATERWEEFFKKVSQVVYITNSENSPLEFPEDVRQEIGKIAESLKAIDVQTVKDMAKKMPQLSSQLVPVSKAFLAAVDTVVSLRESSYRLLNIIDS